jgi:hypothetical protein
MRHIKKVLSIIIYLGYILIAISCLLLILGLFGLIGLDLYSYGLSSGIRMIGTLAISGCLLSAIGNYVLEFDSK